MPLEAATYIDDLVVTNPAATDGSGQGDDHIRLIKSVLQATFPAITGAVTLTHTEINTLETRADALEAADVALDARLDIVEAAYVKKDGSVAMTGDLDMGSNQISNVGAPAAASDAARKSDVDAKLTDVLTTRGDIIRGGVAGAEERLALGASGRYLTSDGTDVVWSSGSVGKVVQVVHTMPGTVATGSTIIPSDDTIPQNTEGDEYMSLAITPTSASNYLKVDVVFYAALTTGQPVNAALFRDSGADAVAAGSASVGAGNLPVLVPLTYYVLAGSTNPTTFKVRGGCSSAGTMTFNGINGVRRFGGVAASSITITEIAA